MVLGVDKLLELVEKENLVENLCERELTNPEGTAFDLRAGEFYKLVGDSFLGETERETGKIESVAKYEEGKTSSLTIKPGEFYLVKTIEKFNMPNNLLAELKPRGTLQRMGVFLRASMIDPGYSGEITMALVNVGPQKATIELGARIANVTFFEVTGETNAYRGQWKGGRVTTDGKEVQI